MNTNNVYVQIIWWWSTTTYRTLQVLNLQRITVLSVIWHVNVTAVKQSKSTNIWTDCQINTLIHVYATNDWKQVYVYTNSRELQKQRARSCNSNLKHWNIILERLNYCKYQMIVTVYVYTFLNVYFIVLIPSASFQVKNIIFKRPPLSPGSSSCPAAGRHFFDHKYQFSQSNKTHSYLFRRHKSWCLAGHAFGTTSFSFCK